MEERRREAAPIDPQEAKDRARIQELFHGVIKSRCREGGIPHPRRLPRLDALPIARSTEDQQWFPVPGMYGGFNYHLELGNEGLQLIADSWVRVVDGSGMRHLITPTQALLIDQGFV